MNRHEESDDGSSIGSGARFIGEFLRNHINKMPTDNLLVGIFDFDREGFDQIKGLRNLYNPISIDGFDNCLIYQHKNNTNFYAISLVTPEFRVNFTHNQQPQHCHLSSELLLMDEEIPAANRSYPTRFDYTVYHFSGRKKAFVDRVSGKIDTGNRIDFSGFEPTINLLERLREITNTPLD